MVSNTQIPSPFFLDLLSLVCASSVSSWVLKRPPNKTKAQFLSVFSAPLQHWSVFIKDKRGSLIGKGPLTLHWPGSPGMLERPCQSGTHTAPPQSFYGSLHPADSPPAGWGCQGLRANAPAGPVLRAWMTKSMWWDTYYRVKPHSSGTKPCSINTKQKYKLPHVSWAEIKYLIWEAYFS
jgi:hypothetical protein